MEHYAKQAEERKKKFNTKLAPKDIKDHSFCTTTIGLIITRVINLCHTGKGHLRWWRSLIMGAINLWMLLVLW